MQVFVIIHNTGIMINADVNAKNHLTKGICSKVFIWNPSNWECKCDKSCDVGEYLDYANCKCRKILIDKLVEECTENIDEVKIAKITLMESTEDENKCKSLYAIYVVLIAIVFTLELVVILFTTSTWIMIKKLLLNMIMSIKHQIVNINGKEINIKNRTYYFFNDMINIKDFDPNLLKIDKKSYKNIDIYYIGYITMKDSDYVKINSVNPFYLIIDAIEGHVEKKMEINT